MDGNKPIELRFDGVVLSKKNSKVIRYNRKTGRNFITSNSSAKQNEAEMVMQFRSQIAKIRGYEPEKMKPCMIEFWIWEPDKRRRDLDNQVTAVLDALVRAGVLVDDNTDVVQITQAAMMGIDKNQPRVEVTIREIFDEVIEEDEK